MVDKKKKIERWVIDFEKAKVMKLRANKEPDVTQSNLFECKDSAILELRSTIIKKQKQLIRDIEFSRMELLFFEKALKELDTPEGDLEGEDLSDS